MKLGPKKHTMVNGHFKSLGAFDCPTGKSGKSILFEKDKMTIRLKKKVGDRKDTYVIYLFMCVDLDLYVSCA